MSHPRFPAATRLLISVRNVPEALAAVAGGADIIDVKEPARGPLGRADRAMIEDIRAAIAPVPAYDQPLSAALGELSECRDFAAVCPSHLDWVKVGLSQTRDFDWRTRWMALKKFVSEHSPRTKLIAVVYADWRDCGAPDPREIIELALETETPGVLFDTYSKLGTSLFDGLAPNQLADFISQLQGHQRFAALAGGLSAKHIPSVLSLRPDIIAVRSAVCAGGRHGEVQSDRVRKFRADLRLPIQPTPTAT